jgi:hypothetical protein
MNNRYSFIGSKQGTWQVVEVRSILEPGLKLVERVNIVNDAVAELPLNSTWVL